MSGALSALNTMRDAAKAGAEPLKAAVTVYADAVRSLNYATDLDAGARAVAELHLAAEALNSAVGTVMQDSRNALAAYMHETGCPGLYTEHHHITPTTPVRSVVVTDEAALRACHPGLWEPQPPTLNRKKLAAALKQGNTPGATLSNGGAPGVRFSTIKKG